MITKEIVQRVQSLYSKGVQSDDSRLTSRNIYNKMITVRSKLISQEAKKNQTTSQWNYQTLDCIELIKALPYECPCQPAVGCEIYRTKEKLPRPLTDLNGHLIQSVTNVTGSIVYDEITWKDKKDKQYEKYTSARPDYYIRNEYMYITQKKGAEVISITGLWDDPWVAYNYPSSCSATSEVTCLSPLDMDFPIDGDMIDTMVELAVKELVIVFQEGLQDTSNNAQDDAGRRERTQRARRTLDSNQQQ